MTDPLHLAEFTTTGLSAFLDQAAHPVALWPVGSTEPHGPHLPLATDVILADENAIRAARALRKMGINAVVVPSLPFGVTDFAVGFTGALTIPAQTLIDLLCATTKVLLSDGFEHVCLINHHLEPGQLKALSAARDRIAESHGAQAISLPLVMSRRWGRELGDEFRSGACHAGQYEGSLVLAARPELVDRSKMATLPSLNVSLSAAIRAGQHSFSDAGMTHAYTGHPADASADEGQSLYDVLTKMVATEVAEAIGHRAIPLETV